MRTVWLAVPVTTMVNSALLTVVPTAKDSMLAPEERRGLKEGQEGGWVWDGNKEAGRSVVNGG